LYTNGKDKKDQSEITQFFRNEHTEVTEKQGYENHRRNIERKSFDLDAAQHKAKRYHQE
jgi:hypothetical protein